MQDLQKFWGLVVEVWDQGFLGVDIARIGIAILVFALFLLLRGLLTRFVLDWLKMLAKRTRSHLDDEIIAALREPIRLIPVALGAFFAFEHLALEDTFKNIGDNIVRSLIAFVIFWGFWRVVQPASRGLRQLERVFTQELVDWLVKAVKSPSSWSAQRQSCKFGVFRSAPSSLVPDCSASPSRLAPRTCSKISFPAFLSSVRSVSARVITSLSRTPSKASSRASVFAPP